MRSNDDDDEPRGQLPSTNGHVPPVRMYRSVVLTSVRQFTDPESPTTEKDGADISVADDDSMETEDLPDPDAGYFNAAFEDFDEENSTEKQSNPSLKIGRVLEVVRGDVDVFNEEDEDMASSTSDSSSDSSDTESVKHVLLENEEPSDDIPKFVEVTSSQLPSPEVPSVEIINSRPLTPEDLLDSQNDLPSEVKHDGLLGLDEHRLTVEQVIMDRFRHGEVAPTSNEIRTGSPLGSRTPPPTPAHDCFVSFQDSPVTVDYQPSLSQMESIDLSDDNVSPPDPIQRLEGDEIRQGEEALHHHPSPLLVVDPQIEEDKKMDLTVDETKSKESDVRITPSAKLSRRMSRDEGTQTDLSGLGGRLHANHVAVASTEQSVSVIQHQQIQLQVDTAAKDVALSSPMSDGEVFAPGSANNEDEDSFYGSDKEVDGEVVFSHTDTSPSSTSSSGSDVEPDRKLKEVILF